MIIHRQVPWGIGRHSQASAQLPSRQVDPYCGIRRSPPHITGLAHQCFWGYDDDHRDDTYAGLIADRRWFTQLEHSDLAETLWRTIGDHAYSVDWDEGEERRNAALLATIQPQTPPDDTAVSGKGRGHDLVTPMSHI